MKWNFGVTLMAVATLVYLIAVIVIMSPAMIAEVCK